MWTLGTVGGPTWSWWSRKGQRSLDLKKGKGLDEEWGKGDGGRNRVPGRRNSVCKGPEVPLSLKKLGISEDLTKGKCSTEGSSSKPKPYL